MDSREYVFIYPLKTNADIPSDFPPAIRMRSLETGVFLPQDDSNWFARPPKYPARLLLLEGPALHIVPHPASGQPSVEIKLDELLQIETGTILLFGWLRFTTRCGVQEIIYNTRASGPLEKFLLALKRRWLRTFSNVHSNHTDVYGDELDIKFRNSLHFELVEHETALAQYFQAPVRDEKKILFFRRVDWTAGNLVLITSMNRLVWITDRHRERREVYASISFSAAVSSLRIASIEDVRGNQHLILSFNCGNSWRIPIHDRTKEVSSFLRSLNR